MPEELRLSQGVRQGGTIHLDQWLPPAWAPLVDPAGDRGLARARFALDEHGGRCALDAPVRRKDFPKLLPELAQRSTEVELPRTRLLAPVLVAAICRRSSGSFSTIKTRNPVRLAGRMTQ